MIDLVFLANEAVVVMGLGKSGLATARALAQSRARVRVWDDSAERRAAAAAEGLTVADPLASGPEAGLAGVALLVLSPGIPLTHPAPHPVAALALGIPIVGDIDLLGRAQREARYLGITGTNGKSTTTALIAHIVRQAGRPVEVGGNLGIPALELAPLGAGGLYVIEMSSYQLDLTTSITFDVAVLTNITPDHLDRHGGMDGYIAAKEQIFRGLEPKPRTAVIGVDDEPSRALAQRLAQRVVPRGGLKVVPISGERPVPGGVWVGDDRWLIDDTEGKAARVFDLATVATLPGRHNGQNAAAAWAACRAEGLHPSLIALGMASFPGLAHRQQLVATSAEGIVFVNDSKATNADAAGKALACYDNLYWIIGGRPKAGGLDGLEPLLGRVRRAFLIGEASDAFAVWLEARGVAWQRSGTLDLATAQAYDSARAARAADPTGPAPVVLLSPACASFDQFPNFEVRGDAFAAAVAALLREP